MSSFTFPIKSQPSLFLSSDIPNEKFIQDQKAYRDRYKDIVLPPNLLAGKWIKSPHGKLEVMTDIEFKISYYGEMVSFDKEWLAGLVKNKNINLLVFEMDELMNHVIKYNKVKDYKVEALIRKNMGGYREIFIEIWKSLDDEETKNNYWDLYQKLFP